MRLLSLARLWFCLVLAAGLAGSAAGQGRPPAPPPPGGGPGGPPNGPPNGGPPPGAPPPNGRGPGAPGSASASANRPAHNQFGPVGRWWDDKSVVRAIGLSREQQKKMDVIFNANKPAILATYKTFLGEQARLDALGKQPNVDQAELFSAIDSVSKARAALEKANTQMLLQIRQQMDSAQIGKLEQLR